MGKLTLEERLVELERREDLAELAILALIELCELPKLGELEFMRGDFSEQVDRLQKFHDGIHGRNGKGQAA